MYPINLKAIAKRILIIAKKMLIIPKIIPVSIFCYSVYLEHGLLLFTVFYNVLIYN
jgi:hypothetical protein